MKETPVADKQHLPPGLIDAAMFKDAMERFGGSRLRNSILSQRGERPMTGQKSEAGQITDTYFQSAFAGLDADAPLALLNDRDNDGVVCE